DELRARAQAASGLELQEEHVRLPLGHALEIGHVGEDLLDGTFDEDGCLRAGHGRVLAHSMVPMQVRQRVDAVELPAGSRQKPRKGGVTFAGRSGITFGAMGRVLRGLRRRVRLWAGGAALTGEDSCWGLSFWRLR